MNKITNNLTKAPATNELHNRVFIFLIAFALFASFGKSPFYDPDTGWHVRAGEFILQHLSVPFQDPWTFTADQQWYNISWLYDIFLAVIFKITGGFGLYYANAIICALIISELYRLLDCFGNFKYDAKLVSLAMAGMLLHPVAMMRPQLVCYLIAIYAMVAIHLSKRDARKLYWAVPLTILWTNIHGSFVIMFVLLGVHFVEALVEKKYAMLKQIIIVGLVCLASTLINPVGYKIYVGIDRTMDSAISAYLLEWQPWNIKWNTFALIPIMLIIGLPVIFGTAKVALSQRIMVVFWLMMTFNSLRFIGFLGVFSVPFFAALLSQFTRPAKYTIPEFARWALLVVLLTSHSYSKDWWINKVERNDHRQAIAFLLKNYAGKNIFNDYTLGGYIIFIGNGEVKHFIDGRAGTAFSEGFIKEYIDFAFNRKMSLSDYLAKHGNPKVAIIKLNSGEGGYLDILFKNSAWKQVYRDNLTAIYEKTSS